MAQNLRKETGLEISDRIRVRFDGAQPLVQAVATHHAMLCDELLAEAITHHPGLATGETLKLDGAPLRIDLEKVT
ncbi:MAG: hypothetical protein HQL66_13145 [Magnetococcales bacterium]|nr:hypothetical protein [Magnetococcales bacterium]